MESCIARQPIFNKKLNIFGYELLYRKYIQNVQGDLGGDTATSETIITGFHEMGIERITGGKRAFVNFSENLLLDDVASLLPSRILVIEVKDAISPTVSVLDACKKLRKRGYMLAFGDFAFEPQFEAFLPLADIVKINFQQIPVDKIKLLAASLRGKEAKLLADHLETQDEFETAKGMGFLLFQGSFFSKPVVMESNKMPSPLKFNCMQLIRLAMSPTVNFTKISSIIKHDAVLSYRLLRVVNSAFFGLKYTVQNIRQALAILGMDEVKKWITLISLSELNDEKPDELLRISLIRAQFLELVGPTAGIASKNADDLFMVGMMSLMDALMDAPIEEIIQRTNISPAIAQPILTGEGVYGDLLSIIIQYENSEWESALATAARYHITPEQMTQAYLEAVEWASNWQF